MPSSPTRAPRSRTRPGSIRAAVRMMDERGHAPGETLERRRRLVANLCRILGDQIGGGRASGPLDHSAVVEPQPPGGVSLSPRMRQTLERLLAGDSEKQIAGRLGLSRHTVHVYVKSLYRRFGVNSRGELFAQFVRRVS